MQALYLIELSKRGSPIPAALPPGPFPPVAGAGGLGAMQQAAAGDIYSAGGGVPAMPPRAAYQPGAPAPLPFASQVPGLPEDRVAALPAADQLRLQGEREAALRAEAEQRKAEEERAAAAAKKEFFTRSLGDMRLTQSKVTRAVVEAQQRCVASGGREGQDAARLCMHAWIESGVAGFSGSAAQRAPLLIAMRPLLLPFCPSRCEMEAAAAAAMEADYSRAYAEFSAQHAQHAPLVARLKQARSGAGAGRAA